MKYVVIGNSDLTGPFIIENKSDYETEDAQEILKSLKTEIFAEIESELPLSVLREKFYKPTRIRKNIDNY